MSFRSVSWQLLVSAVFALVTMWALLTVDQVGTPYYEPVTAYGPAPPGFHSVSRFVNPNSVPIPTGETRLVYPRTRLINMISPGPEWNGQVVVLTGFIVGLVAYLLLRATSALLLAWRRW